MLKKTEKFITNNLFFLIMIYIFLLNIIQIQMNNKNNILSILIICIVISLFVILVKKVIQIKNKKIISILNIALLVIYFISLLYIGSNLKVYSKYKDGIYTWDYGQIQDSAIEYVKTGELSNSSHIYFSKYVNNRLVLVILIFIYKIFNIIGINNVEHFRIISIIFNCIFIEGAYILTYFLAKKIKDEKFAFLTLFLILLLLPLSAYSTIFYTDMLGLIFIPLSLLIYLKFKETKKIRYLVLISLISLIGFEIKATVIFAFLALTINIISNKENYKSMLKNLFILIITFICFYLIIEICFNYFLKIKSSDKDRYMFPYTHYIMMMLNKSGGYNYGDVAYTSKYKTYKEKKSANFEEIKRRIESRGIDNTAYHLLVTKAIRTWTNSTFGSSDYVGRSPINDTWLRQLISEKGSNYKYFKTYSDTYWIIILLGMIITYFNKDELDVIHISKQIIIFHVLFLTIWECNSRYLIHMMYIIILISIYGWYNCIDYKKRKR